MLYEKRGQAGRAKGATKSEYDLSDPELRSLIEPDLWEQLQEDVELLEVGEGLAGGGSWRGGGRIWFQNRQQADQGG